MPHPYHPADSLPRRRRRLLMSALATAGVTAFLGATAMTGSAGAIVRGQDSTERYPFVTPPPPEGGFSLCRLGFATDQPGP